MLNWFRNLVTSKYASHPEAVIVACYFNPKNSRARLNAFNKWYDSIKHLNHRIIECVQDGVGQQLPTTPHIMRIRSNNTLWYKEQLLNKVISSLPPEFRYVLWVDTDVLFRNRYWVVDAVKELQRNKVVQLFEYAIHLDKGQDRPSFDVEDEREYIHVHDLAVVKIDNRRMWKGYASNYASRDLESKIKYKSDHYDIRGHVGFAWGARREVLNAVPLYDRALIGGGDGIIAYASTGQLPDIRMVREMFKDTIEDVYAWGRRWHSVVNGQVGFVEGDLYHLWHGDIKKRQYYSRTRDFGQHLKRIQQESVLDENGLYVARDPKARQYVNDYYNHREPDDQFATSVALGYVLDDGVTGGLLGGNLVGGMIGDALNNTDTSVIESHPTSQPSSQPTDHPSTQPSGGSDDLNIESNSTNYAEPSDGGSYSASDNNQNAS